jgi:glycosyltransferase involved in cell wall biosynthesis
VTKGDSKQWPRISVVTPTFRRPTEVAQLLENLSRQTILPIELILVDGAPDEERETETAVAGLAGELPYQCRYLKHDRGTAIQRNAGIDLATGEFIAFIDDDVRLEPDFFERILAAFSEDTERSVGGIVGYRLNRQLNSENGKRWLWYRKLRLLKVFEPGRYDFQTGYPINANLQPPFTGLRPVDFMTTACAVWRREVFDSGLRFDRFFSDYGVLEDAHLSLRAGRLWQLLQCGDARCSELHASPGRVDGRKLGYKCVVNYYFVFSDIVKPLTWRHQFRFWRFQAFEMVRLFASLVRHQNQSSLLEMRGRFDGMRTIALGVSEQVAK